MERGKIDLQEGRLQRMKAEVMTMDAVEYASLFEDEFFDIDKDRTKQIKGATKCR